MSFSIVMGVPVMEALWNYYQTKYREGTLSKRETRIYKKWGKTLKFLST